MEKEFQGYNKLNANEFVKQSKKGQTTLNGKIWELVESKVKYDTRGIIFDQKYKERKVW